MNLATYEYTNDANRYLSKLDYGNEGSVEYTYDDKGRLLTQTYEDGDKVTYTYDNNGALATMVDSATGITTTYYYDLSDRMMKYVESGTNYSHSVEYTYDEKNNLKKLEESINGVDHITEYDYDDDNRIKTVTVNGTTVTYNYDAFGRVTEKVITKGDAELRKETYTYVNPANGKTSAQVATHTIVIGNTTQTFTYTYDGNGNITSIYDGTSTTAYTYDSANQLIREDNKSRGYTYTWTYDDAGNILRRKEYDYTTGSLDGISPDYTAENTYSTSGWGDLPTSYDSDSVECDAIGNITDDLTWQYTWEHGRQLASMFDGSDTWNFTYNADGIRTQRTDGDTTYNYIYNGSQLTEMTANGHTLYFTYDAEGKPSTVTMDGETYYYVTNLQGDVLYILDADGLDVVRYDYNAFGKTYWTEPFGPDDLTIGKLNPLCYRGYVYDQETGLYYLQSRYYNPEIGRFINADAFTATGQGFVGNNMFAYCGNNPVLLKEYNGQFGVIASMAIGLAVGLATQYLCDIVSNAMDHKTGKDLFMPKSTVGEYITAGMSGMVCAIPGASTLVSVVCDVAAPAVEQGIDYLIHGDEWDSQEYIMDVSSNIMCDIVSSTLSIEPPQYIRDIKDDAQELGIKGTKQLNKYLTRQKNKTFLANEVIDATVSVGYEFVSGVKPSSNRRPATFRGLII